MAPGASRPAGRLFTAPAAGPPASRCA